MPPEQRCAPPSALSVGMACWFRQQKMPDDWPSVTPANPWSASGNIGVAKSANAGWLDGRVFKKAALKTESCLLNKWNEPVA